MRHQHSPTEKPLQRLRRALAVLRGRDDIDQHPDSWAHRARWWDEGRRSQDRSSK